MSVSKSLHYYIGMCVRFRIPVSAVVYIGKENIQGYDAMIRGKIKIMCVFVCVF